MMQSVQSFSVPRQKQRIIDYSKSGISEGVTNNSIERAMPAPV